MSAPRKSRLPVLLIVGIVLLLPFSYGLMFISTLNDKRKVRKEIVVGRPFSELVTVLGRPTNTNLDPALVQRSFPDLFPASGFTNTTLYAWNREGIPYWRAVVAVESQTERITWGVVKAYPLW